MHQAQVVHQRVGGGENEIAGRVDAARLAGDLLDFAVQIDRIFLQTTDVRVRVVGVDASGRMPGGARGQLVLFEQRDVSPAGLRQVIEDARADDAAADHDGAVVGFHERVLDDDGSGTGVARRRAIAIGWDPG
jgi:hypothetical protein